MNLGSAAPRRNRPRIGIPAAPSRLVTAVGVFLILAAAAWGVFESRSMDRRRQAAEIELARLRQAARDREQAEARLLAAREAHERAGRLERRVARWVEEREILATLLRGLSGRLRDDVVLDSLRRDGRGFAITGRAASGDAVTAAVRELGRLDPVAQLDLLFVERDAGADRPPGDSEDLPAGGAQRFALEGILGYSSPEPAPFGAVAPVEGPDR